MLIAFNKPYGVLSQFTGDGSPNRTLAEFGFPAGVYADWPAGCGFGGAAAVER